MQLIVAYFLFFAVILGTLSAQRAPGHPPFLDGAPVAVIDNFHDLILANGHLTDAQMRREVDDWRQYADFDVSLSKAIHEHNVAHARAISRFSPSAKKADARLHELINDPDLSIKEKHEKAEAFYSSLPSDVQDEIERAMRGGQ